MYRGEDSVTMGGASDSGSDGEVVNNDIDGDGVPNDQDAFPEDAAASVDTDGDGTQMHGITTVTLRVIAPLG